MSIFVRFEVRVEIGAGCLPFKKPSTRDNHIQLSLGGFAMRAGNVFASVRAQVGTTIAKRRLHLTADKAEEVLSGVGVADLGRVAQG